MDKVRYFKERTISDCPNFELELQERKIEELDKTLHKEKQKYLENKKHREQRYRIVNLKMQIIQESLSKLRKYQKDVNEAVMKSNQKLRKNEEIYEAKSKEVKNKAAELYTLIDICFKFQRRRYNLNYCKDFLHDVKNNSNGEFTSVQNIIQRHDFLIETRNDFIKRSELTNEKICQMKLENYLKIQKEEREMLETLGKLLELQEKKEKQDLLFEDLSIKLIEIKKNLADKTLTCGKLKLAIDNLSHIIWEKLNEPLPPGELSISEATNYIKSGLKELEKLKNRVCEHETNTFK